MAYQRKTKDEWRLHVNYGQGFEHEVSEYRRRDIRDQVICYRMNSPQYRLKVTGPHRVKVEECRA